MSIQDEMDKIPKQKLTSDMPDTFTATIVSMTKDVKKGQFAGAPILKVELLLEDGEKFTTAYRIPKTWTGKGQMDIFMENLKNMNQTLTTAIGKTFKWQRKELEGAMKGNPRHYPIQLIKTKPVKP